MADIRNQDHFNAVLAHAESLGMTEQFESRLQRLESLATNFKGTLVLGYDFAPHSLSWSVIVDPPEGEVRCVYNGALIFHGEEHGWQSHS